MAGQSSAGTLLGYGATPTNIGDIASIEGPNPTAERIDITPLDSTSAYRTFVAGFKDPGTVTFTLMMDGSNTGMQNLWTLYGSGASEDWTITLPDTSTLEFAGTVTQPPGITASVGDRIEGTCEISISGAITATWA